MGGSSVYRFTGIEQQSKAEKCCVRGKRNEEARAAGVCSRAEKQHKTTCMRSPLPACNC